MAQVLLSVKYVPSVSQDYQRYYPEKYFANYGIAAQYSEAGANDCAGHVAGDHWNCD